MEAVGGAVRETKALDWPKLLRRALLFAVIVPVTYFAVTFVQVWWTSRPDPRHRLRAGPRGRHLAHPDQPDQGPVGVPPHDHGDGPGGDRPGDRFPPPRAGRAALRGFSTGGLRRPSRYPLRRPVGGGVIGNTAGSGPAIRGSSPCPRALKQQVRGPVWGPFPGSLGDLSGFAESPA